MSPTPHLESMRTDWVRSPASALAWVPVIALSGWLAVDLYVWAIEVAAIAFAFVVVRALDNRHFCAGEPPTLAMAAFPRGVYWLLHAYMLVMLIGATWTYAGAPPGAWLEHVLGLARNPWDRVGHLLQGALPAWITLQLRVRGRAPRRLVSQLALGLAAGLAIAGLFEGLEALAASAAPAGVDFVQTQGDPLDRWWDLGFALTGASVATLGANGLRVRARAGARAAESPADSWT